MRLKLHRRQCSVKVVFAKQSTVKPLKCNMKFREYKKAIHQDCLFVRCDKTYFARNNTVDRAGTSTAGPPPSRTPFILTSPVAVSNGICHVTPSPGNRNGGRGCPVAGAKVRGLCHRRLSRRPAQHRGNGHSTRPSAPENRPRYTARCLRVR